MTVAALFVDTGGIYFDDPRFDPWDESRDARTYAGPHPVIAHPPCARWCQLAAVNQARYGHKIGDDGGCFESALASVRKFGGVLEHPALTFAWGKFGMPSPPSSGGWIKTFCGGWTCHVEQRNYGHGARKATWLYAFGVDPPSLKWGRGPKPAALDQRRPTSSRTRSDGYSADAEARSEGNTSGVPRTSIFDCARSQRMNAPSAPEPRGQESDGDIVRELDHIATECWPFALMVSNINQPERDNTFGRATVVMRKASATIARLQREAEGLTRERDEARRLIYAMYVPLKKLLRTHDCFVDDEGTDIGRPMLDALTTLGWLERAQRSPAMWTITSAGTAIIDAAAFLECPNCVTPWKCNGPHFGQVPAFDNSDSETQG